MGWFEVLTHSQKVTHCALAIAIKAVLNAGILHDGYAIAVSAVAAAAMAVTTAIRIVATIVLLTNCQ